MNENNSKIKKIKKSGHIALILVRIAKTFSIAMSVVTIGCQFVHDGSYINLSCHRFSLYGEGVP